MKSAGLVEAAAAITAIVQIAGIQDSAGGACPFPDTALDALEEVGAWGRVALRERLSAVDVAPWLRAADEFGLPEPVLTNTGAGHLEVPWTNYIFRALGGEPLAYEARGNRLAEVLFRHQTAGPAQPEGIRLFRELPLAEHRCPTCGEGVHYCSLDLALVGATAAVAIEHKVRSPPSDFKYRPCDHPGSQSVAYEERFRAWCRGAGVEPSFVWLSLGGAARAGWTTMTHARLAEILAPSLRELETRGDRYRGAAFVLDLASAVVAEFSNTLRLAAAYRRAPDDDSLAALLGPRLERASHHVILHGILDALV